VRLALDLDTIVRCRATGDYSLDPAGKGPITGLVRAWRMYRCARAHARMHAPSARLLGLLAVCAPFSICSPASEHLC
jgi:hypothetical protein